MTIVKWIAPAPSSAAIEDQVQWLRGASNDQSKESAEEVRLALAYSPEPGDVISRRHPADR
jgi:hypothetical protein